MQRSAFLTECLNQAVDSVDIPYMQRYFDSDDNGIKKDLQIEGDDMSMGASIRTYLNPFGENIGTDYDSVYFMTEYNHHDSDETFYLERSLAFYFNHNGLHITNHGFVVSNPAKPISDLNDTPEEISAHEQEAIDWVRNSTNTLGLFFTLCMNYEPYEPGDWAAKVPIQPPVFPTFETD